MTDLQSAARLAPKMTSDGLRSPSTQMGRRAALRLMAVGAVAGLAACARAGGGATAAAEPAVAANAAVTARGSFEGRSNHVTTGHARVVRAGGQWVIELEEDFFFDGAPDPKVALGNGGFDPATLHGPLRSNSGRQAYALKAGLNIGDYTEVWIWCEKFNVPLGVAKLALV